MAQSPLDARIAWESGRGAISGRVGRADAPAAIVVTGGGVMSGDQSGRENMTGNHWGYRSSGGFGHRLCAGGGRGGGAGDGELGGVVRFGSL